MDCPICEIEEIESGRLALGYKTCLTCGEAAAQEEAAAKSRRVAIAYSKGGYQYITDDTNLEDLG
jgi:hypothetical protein